MSSKKKPAPKPVKKTAPAKKAEPAKKPVPAKKAAPAKPAPAKKIAPAKKTEPAKKPVPAKKTEPVKKPAPAKKAAAVNPSPAKKTEPVKKTVPVKKAAPAKKTEHVEKTEPVKTASELAAKPALPKIESSLLVAGMKFVKLPFFFDAEKDEKKTKRGALQKGPEKPTACSRPKIGNVMDTKSLVELLSQQLEFENKMFFEGCEGQICVKCNVNNVDSKFYVDKSLGYCIDCATLLNLGQSKEGVFSDAQMELMRRSMEKSMENAKDIDENDIESAFDDMDSLELEEALLAAAAEEEADLNA